MVFFCTASSALGSRQHKANLAFSCTASASCKHWLVALPCCGNNTAQPVTGRLILLGFIVQRAGVRIATRRQAVISYFSLIFRQPSQVSEQYLKLGHSQFHICLAAFAKLRIANISFVMSVCLSVRIEQLGSHRTDFRKI